VREKRSGNTSRNRGRRTAIRKEAKKCESEKIKVAKRRKNAKGETDNQKTKESRYNEKA